MSVLATVYSRAAEGIVRVVLVEPIIFVKHGYSGRFNRRYVSEHIPHTFKMVVHFSAAAHEESLCYVLATVAAAARKIELFKKMNVFALDLPVADEIERRRKSGKTGADYISRFFIGVLRLFGARE